MDLTRVTQAEDPVNEDLFGTSTNTLRGGRVIEHNVKDMSGAIIDSLNH